MPIIKSAKSAVPATVNGEHLHFTPLGNWEGRRCVMIHEPGDLPFLVSPERRSGIASVTE